jgi:hypothetical protein
VAAGAFSGHCKLHSFVRVKTDITSE